MDVNKKVRLTISAEGAERDIIIDVLRDPDTHMLKPIEVTKLADLKNDNVHDVSEVVGVILYDMIECIGIEIFEKPRKDTILTDIMLNQKPGEA